MRKAPLVLVLSAATLAAPSIAASSATAVPRSSGTSTLVRTDKGLVRGAHLHRHRLFQGIPFAAPPLGALRFRPPQDARPWTGVRDATFPRNRCAQIAQDWGGTSSFSEDCLYLSVTAPDRPPHRRKRKLPVMVWVHGGGNVIGAGSDYNTSKLAVNGDVVVVSVNYRLGALGWLAHPGLEAGPDRHLQAGNYGLLDQQAALRWVRRNIAAFGGDAHNVTLFGESAGSADTCANIASPTAAGLFHKAIAQSYGCAAVTRAEASAEASAVTVAKKVGCTVEVARCLRTVPTKRLMEAFNEVEVMPYAVAGGDRVMPRQPRAAIESGRFNRVPLMHGNTLDEMRLFVGFLYPKPITVAEYERVIRESFGRHADRVLAHYPAAKYPEPRLALATVFSHGGNVLSTCDHVTALDVFRRAGVPVYGYQFADRTAPPLIDVPGYDEGAEHGTELTYLFPGLIGELKGPQRRLSNDMTGYWTSFAHTGRPGAHHAPHWPRYRSARDVLTLAPGRGGIRPTDVAEASNCALWGTIDPILP
ncbi:carboxylesterase/lipase family protein [Thermomonospora umbrina]|nr:carboxylesterase family protein [Thermomonospora umbrina]